MGLPYEVGDIVTLKKVHPCGSRDWEILSMYFLEKIENILRNFLFL